MDNCDKYRQLLLGVDRPGVEEFLLWLSGTDFFTAPCSTKYHLAREGGLAEHSLNVYDVLMSQAMRFEDIYGVKIGWESIAICSLCHDICKADFYDIEMRNTKEDGKWVQRPFYMVKDAIPLGHGEKSVILLQRFIDLKREEVLAVRWHMGGFTPGITDYSVSQAFNEAAKMTPLVILLHMADMESTYLKETV